MIRRNDEAVSSSGTRSDTLWLTLGNETQRIPIAPLRVQPHRLQNASAIRDRAPLRRRHIANQPNASVTVHAQNRAPVRHRIRQPLISIVTAGEISERFTRYPILYTGCRNPGPRKRLIGNRLIQPIDAHRIMCRACRGMRCARPDRPRCRRRFLNPRASAIHSWPGSG